MGKEKHGDSSSLGRNKYESLVGILCIIWASTLKQIKFLWKFFAIKLLRPRPPRTKGSLLLLHFHPACAAAGV